MTGARTGGGVEGCGGIAAGWLTRTVSPSQEALVSNAALETSLCAGEGAVCVPAVAWFRSTTTFIPPMEIASSCNRIIVLMPMLRPFTKVPFLLPRSRIQSMHSSSNRTQWLALTVSLNSLQVAVCCATNDQLALGNRDQLSRRRAAEDLETRVQLGHAFPFGFQRTFDFKRSAAC